MMPDLIDRKALLAEVNRTIDIMEKRKDRISVRNVIMCVKNAPTVDAVEVVRCKDCKYLMHSAIYKKHFCTNIYGLRDICISKNDFCSYGERREGE